MTDFTFPSDADRAENEDLNRACEYIEALLEKQERILRVSRRRGQEHREMEASLMLAQSLLHRAATLTVGYRGIVPIFAQEYDKKLKADLESYQVKEPSTALKCYVAQCQVEVLEEAASLVQGYSKRLVENKVRILKKVADEGVCNE